MWKVHTKILIYTTKQKYFFKKSKKNNDLKIWCVEVHCGHIPSFLLFAKLAIQNPNIQPVVFLPKIKDQQSMSLFSYCHLMNF